MSSSDTTYALQESWEGETEGEGMQRDYLKRQWLKTSKLNKDINIQIKKSEELQVR